MIWPHALQYMAGASRQSILRTRAPSGSGQRELKSGQLRSGQLETGWRKTGRRNTGQRAVFPAIAGRFQRIAFRWPFYR